MYDRAGMGESTFADPRVRTLEQLADELHQLTVRKNWGNVVLVAHSFGGFIARTYASKYRTDVRGILFLDAPHEDWLPRLQAAMSEADWSIMERILTWNVSNFHEDYIEARWCLSHGEHR
jgi:pimeloyl-ACP methyl ester carboxylesterase